MYNPPKFLTPEILSEVMSEFTWPAAFTLDDDRPDGISIILPNCNLYVTEGFESEMDLLFGSETTALDRYVRLGDALSAIRNDPARTLPAEPKLIAYFSPGASIDKVKNGLRDLFTLLFTYFPGSLEGDFNWIAAYRAYRRN